LYVLPAELSWEIARCGYLTIKFRGPPKAFDTKQ